MRAIAAILLLLASIGAMHAQHLTRRILARAAAATQPSTVAGATADTVRGAALDSVRVAGFEKALRSTRESMFVTNGTARDISGLGIDISYYDTRRRLLHRASHTVAADIPAGETRRVEVPSFDRGGAFYYRLSALPRGARQATPFDVHTRVTYITLQQ